SEQDRVTIAGGLEGVGGLRVPAEQLAQPQDHGAAAGGREVHSGPHLPHAGTEGLVPHGQRGVLADPVGAVVRVEVDRGLLDQLAHPGTGGSRGDRHEASWWSRSSSRHARGRSPAMPTGRWARALMTTSWPRKARARSSASKTSATTALPPRPSMMGTPESRRVTPVTSCPAATSASSASWPRTPVAPVTAILTLASSADEYRGLLQR